MNTIYSKYTDIDLIYAQKIEYLFLHNFDEKAFKKNKGPFSSMLYNKIKKLRSVRAISPLYGPYVYKLAEIINNMAKFELVMLPSEFKMDDYTLKENELFVYS